MKKSLQILDITTTTVDTDLFNITAVNSKQDPYWVEFLEQHVKEAGVEIKILPLYEIDLAKKWIINVDINAWNWHGHRSSVIEKFDTLIQQELQTGNAYLLLNHQCESWTNSFLKTIYTKIKDVPFHKIIYMVAAADIQDIYENFVKENKIPANKRIQVLYVHHVYKRLNTINLAFFNYPRSQKTKKYLSLNRIARSHRVALVSLLSYKNLLDKGFVSLGLMPNEVDERCLFMRNPHQQEGFKKIKNNLPLQVDNIDLTINQFQTNSLPISFYQQSCFSLVSSTFAFEHDEVSVGFTEKEIKPMLARHPFIIFNRPGVLKQMHNMGFLTFERWFDESYDREQNDDQRLEKITNEVERLCNLSFAEWDIMLEEMAPILEHNYNRLVNYTTEHCYFNSDLKKLLYYVS
jgi:hypothetical protein